MKVVGITGGIGSGKTTACRIFEQLGVPVYYADVRAKHLMANNVSLRNTIIATFGDQSFEKNGLNRNYLAEIVFNDKDKLTILNEIVHPAVAKDFKSWLDTQKPANYVLKEAAILFESGAYRNVDITVLVIAPNDLRIARVIERDKVSAENVTKRMTKQWSQERKSKLADYILNNDGLHLLTPQVIELHHKLNLK